MVFDDSFFEGETRCGFEITSEMKHCWAAELELLAFIQDICEEYGITYYAAYGTLLGAVRHGGFIPWDDDIDIFMTRRDYELFMRVLPDNLPLFLRINSNRFQSHHSVIPNIANGYSLPQPPEVVELFHGCPFIVGIDIFILDNLPRDRELRESQSLLAGYVSQFIHTYDEIRKSDEFDSKLNELEELCKTTIDRDGDILRQIYLLYDRIVALVEDEESDIVTFYQSYIGSSMDNVYRREWLGKGTLAPFENTVINIPDDPHSMLTVMFGDYNTPIRYGSGHDYPIYRAQKEYLQGRGLL